MGLGYSPHIYKEVESARDLCLVVLQIIKLLMKTGILSKKVSLKSSKKGICKAKNFLEITQKGDKIRPKFLEKGVFLRCWKSHALHLFRESCTTGLIAIL